MADETLRIYKHGSGSYTDITSATIGGFSSFTRTQVRNDAGSLDFTLSATTAAILHGWMDEAATVELWSDSAKVGVYYVDDYSLRWSDLSCQVQCVGLFSRGRTVLHTGSFVNVAAPGCLQALVELVPGWTWDASKVCSAVYTVVSLAYTDAPVSQIVQEICSLAGLTFWFDTAGKFNAEIVHPTVDESLTLGGNAQDFDTTYSARNIINRVVIAAHSATYTYDDTGSQAIYGIRTARVSAPGIYTAEQALDYSTMIFDSQALPALEGGVWVDYDPTYRPGLLVEVLGLGDSRTYQALIEQTTWVLGDLVEELRIGQQPVTIPPPEYGPVGVDGTTDPGYPSDGGGSGGGSGGGGLLTGTITAVNGDGTVDVTIDGTTHENVPCLLSYDTRTVGDSVAVGTES